MKKEDAEILTLFSDNEESAFRLIFEKYYEVLYTIARLYVHHPEDAEDIVQQLFITLWENKKIQEIHTSLNSYLRNSIKNSCLHFIEKQNTLSKRKMHLPDEETLIQAFDFLLNAEGQKVVEKAINTLPQQSRRTLELVYFKGDSYQDAAKTLQLSVNTVKSHLKNALRLLRDNTSIRNYFHEKN